MMTVYGLMSCKRRREIGLALQAWRGARHWGPAKHPKPWIPVKVGRPSSWMELTVPRLGWVAGFLDGDGSFRFHRTAPRVEATQVDHDGSECLGRLRSLFGGFVRQRKNRGPGNQPQSGWELSGHTAAGLMMTVYRLMSPDRQQRIRDSLLSWRALRLQHGRETHCPQGHPYSGSNLYLNTSKVNRLCVICDRAAGARYRSRKRLPSLTLATQGGFECAS